MPDYNYPPLPTDTGAITIPRMLNRWLDVSYQQGPLRRCQTFITLPSFVTTEQFSSVSDIVASFNFEAPNNFVLTSVLFPPISPNYTLCISFRIGIVLTRYVLWQAAGTVFGMFPLYNGQTILKNFRLEVWNTSQGPAVETVGVTFYTSVLQSVDYRWGADLPLVGNDGQQSSFECSNTQGVSPTVNGVDWWKDTGLLFDGDNYVTWNEHIGSGTVTKYSDGFPWPTQNTDGSGNLSSTVLNFNLSSITEAVTNFFLIVWPNANGEWNLVNNEGTQLLAANCSNTSVSGTSSTVSIFNISFASQPLCYGISGTLSGTTLSIKVYDIRGNLLGSASVTVANLTLKLIHLGLINSVYEVIVSSNTFNFSQYILANYGDLYIPLPMTFPNGSVSTTN